MGEIGCLLSSKEKYAHDYFYFKSIDSIENSNNGNFESSQNFLDPTISFEKVIDKLAEQKAEDDQKLQVLMQIYSRPDIEIENNNSAPESKTVNTIPIDSVGKLRVSRQNNKQATMDKHDCELFEQFQKSIQDSIRHSISEQISNQENLSARYEPKEDYVNNYNHVGEFYAQRRDILEITKVVMQNLIESRKTELVSEGQ